MVRTVGPGRLFFGVKAAPCARKAIFYVDRKQRWVDRSFRWRFGRSGYLPARGLPSGRHVLAANIVRQNGSVIHTSRVVHLNRAPGGDPRWIVGGRAGRAPGQAPPGVIVDPVPGAPPNMVGPLIERRSPPPDSAPPEETPAPPAAETPPPAAETPPPPAEEPSSPPPAEEPTEPPPPPSEEPSEPPPAEEEPSQPPVEEPPAPPAEEIPPPEPPLPPPPSEPSTPPLIDAGFENGLNNWSTAGVGDVTPTVVEDIVETGERSGRVVLTGAENRSELILADRREIIEMPPGTERWYGFAINICTMVYGRPGAHNVIMQLKSDNEGSPRVSLGLWDYQGKRGLWTEGPAMGGNRFLAPMGERQWHDVVVHFKVTTGDTGFYEIYLDGKLVDSREDITVLREGATSAYIKTGLYRNGDEIPGLSEIRVDSAKLGTTLESVEAR